MQDLSHPSAIVLYEKSTRILLRGIFIWIGGNYTFEFVDTNAIFTYYEEPPSEENLLPVIITISIVSIGAIIGLAAIFW